MTGLAATAETDLRSSSVDLVEAHLHPVEAPMDRVEHVVIVAAVVGRALAKGQDAIVG